MASSSLHTSSHPRVYRKNNCSTTTLTSLLNKVRTNPQNSTAEVVNHDTINCLADLLGSDGYDRIADNVNDVRDAENLIEVALLLQDRGLGKLCTEDANSLKSRAKRLILKLGPKLEVLPRSLRVNPGDITMTPNGISFEWGGQGEVYRADYGGSPVVLKRLHKEQAKKYICREALAWRLLSHRHILELIGIYIDQAQSFTALVSPYMEKGTLSEWRKKNPYPCEIETHIFCVAEGLQHIHKERLVHGDLKGSNVLLNEQMQVKIADFGLARHQDATQTKRWTVSCRFTAPELIPDGNELDEDKDDTYKFTAQTDIYSFACLYYEIHFGQLPFAAFNNVYKIGVMVKRGDRPTKGETPVLADQAWKLIERCWDKDPTKRPSMDVVVQTMYSWRRS